MTPELPRTLADEFQRVGEDLYRLGLVTSHGGNLSRRAAGGFWVTMTGARLGALAPPVLSFVADDGAVVGPAPSSDTPIHAAVFRATDAAAVVHAHPACATAWSLVVERFAPLDHEGLLILGEVPVVPQDERVAEAVATALAAAPAVLVRGHGAYARGATLWEAAHAVMALEESARIAWYARGLGYR